MLGLAKTCMKLEIPSRLSGHRLGIPGPDIPNLATLVSPPRADPTAARGEEGGTAVCERVHPFGRRAALPNDCWSSRGPRLRLRAAFVEFTGVCRDLDWTTLMTALTALHPWPEDRRDAKGNPIVRPRALRSEDRVLKLTSKRAFSGNSSRRRDDGGHARQPTHGPFARELSNILRVGPVADVASVRAVASMGVKAGEGRSRASRVALALSSCRSGSAADPASLCDLRDNAVGLLFVLRAIRRRRTSMSCSRPRSALHLATPAR